MTKTFTLARNPVPCARFSPPGWSLLGRWPDEEDGVGSWLLHGGTEALLLEVPPCLSIYRVRRGLERLNCRLVGFTASHGHEDHLDEIAWRNLRHAFPEADPIPPHRTYSAPISLLPAGGWMHRFDLGGEPVFRIGVAKHSPSDVVVVFRGVAMTGDVELGQLASVNDEVPDSVKRRSMAYLASFQERAGYQVHTVMSAHLNDFRTGVDWSLLFECGDA